LDGARLFVLKHSTAIALYWDEITMTSNVGALDRILRFLIAGILLYVGLQNYGYSVMGILLDALGLLAAATGLLGFCGLYSLLGISTRRADRDFTA
jgi:hypothetical protein